MKDILKYKSNKNLNVYKIALNLRKYIDKSQKETFLLKIVNSLSKIVGIPSNIISCQKQSNGYGFIDFGDISLCGSGSGMSRYWKR